MSSTMAAILIKQLNKRDQYVFTYSARREGPDRDRGKNYPITYSGFTTEWGRLPERAAQDAPSLIDPDRWESFRLHDLRHTFGTELARQANGNVKLVRIGAVM
jgi:integrase